VHSYHSGPEETRKGGRRECRNKDGLDAAARRALLNGQRVENANCWAPAGHSQDGGLDDVLEVRARGLEDLAHVGHHLLRLRLEVGAQVENESKV